MNQKQPLNFNLIPDVITTRIFWCLLGFELFIVFLDVFVSHYKWIPIGSIRRMVNITREDSLSNWFSSLQAIAVGSVIWLTAIGVRKQMQDNHYKRKFYCWAGIGTFFIYLGIDDAIKFHERMGTAFKVLLTRDDAASGTGVLGSLYDVFPSYLWQMIFGPFFVSICIFMLWFLWKELSSRKLWDWFLVGIGLYVVAVGLDFIEGLDGAPYEEMGIADFFSTLNDRIKHMSKALEEFLEMLGTTIFLIVFLKNIFGMSREWKITISEKS